MCYADVMACPFPSSLATPHLRRASREFGGTDSAVCTIHRRQILIDPVEVAASNTILFDDRIIKAMERSVREGKEKHESDETYHVLF